MILEIREKISIFLILLSLIGIVVGISVYPGSKIIYGIFSVFFCFCLCFSVNYEKSLSFLILIVLIWSGFWLKITMHLVFLIPYVEPVGDFNFGGSAYDQVLIVASVGLLGLWFGRWITSHFVYKSIYSRIKKNPPIMSRVSGEVFDFLYILILLLIFIITTINSRLGIQQVGMIARTILPGKLNIFFSWLLTYGLIFIVLAIIQWDPRSPKRWKRYLFLVVFEGFFVSSSLMSRSVYIFHVLPFIIACLLDDRYSLSDKKKFLRQGALFIVIGFIFSFLFVSEARIVRYSDNMLQKSYQGGTISEVAFKINEKDTYVIYESKRLEMGNIYKMKAESNQLSIIENSKTTSVVYYPMQQNQNSNLLNTINKASLFSNSDALTEIITRAATTLFVLATGRWIGAEGVMAVQAYNNKGLNLFIKAVSEKREEGKLDIYQEIANSIYLKSNLSEFIFATLPGPIAFFYYSGSLLFVFIGMSFVAIICIFLERVAGKISNNIYIVTWLSINIAFGLSQSGLDLYRAIIGYLMNFIGIGVLAAMPIPQKKQKTVDD
ncbi:MAG: hypothetical protein Q8P40_05485 [Nitrospirota bacterium]|nr:hypothetical protein [Nitrospirota bacterium]